MKTIKAAVLYFALVFATGFVLGTIRVLWIVPHFGTRWAELLEMPVMLAVSFITARWIVRRFAIPFTVPHRLGMGFIALILLLIPEFTLVLRLRGLSVAEYLATKDPVSGTLYYIMLGIFAIAPLLVSKTQQASELPLSTQQPR